MAVLVLDPDGDVRASISARLGLGVIDLEVDDQLVLLVPRRRGRAFWVAGLPAVLGGVLAFEVEDFGSSAKASRPGRGRSYRCQPSLRDVRPSFATIRHSTPGIDLAIRTLSSGSRMLQTLAKASASTARSAMTVAATIRSTGRPDRGSKMCEYHRPLIRNPRWELPLVATDRSLTSM